MVYRDIAKYERKHRYVMFSKCYKFEQGVLTYFCMKVYQKA